MGAVEPHADGAAEPAAIRLDELPAEVRAKSLRPACRRQGCGAKRAPTSRRTQRALRGRCRSCRRARSSLRRYPGPAPVVIQPGNKLLPCSWFAGAHRL